MGIVLNTDDLQPNECVAIVVSLGSAFVWRIRSVP
jgi:hypothetical protein